MNDTESSSSSYPFYWINAFTGTRLEGNPCAVILEADEFPQELMLTVAKEMGLSETAFVRSSSVADFGARYFTPAEEIPLAGHPTLAVTRALIEDRRLPVTGAGKVRFTLELPAGVVEISVQAPGPAGEGQLILMTQRPPVFLQTYDPAEVARVFGLETSDLHGDPAPQTVSTGTPMLMVPVRTKAALRRARMDLDAYLALKETGDFFSPHLFVLEGATSAGDTFARHFGVPPDTQEDAFTGSATGCMGAFLWAHRMIRERRFRAEQGHDMGHPGSGVVEIDGDPGQPERVRVGGEAVALVRGRIELSADSSVRPVGNEATEEVESHERLD